MKPLNVLIACEESQRECEAFRDLGHNAFSCDIQPVRKGGRKEWHIWGDVTELLAGRTRFQTMDGKLHRLSHWDLIVAHPPCTYLCKVGAIWLYKSPNLWIEHKGKKIQVNADRYFRMMEARQFFMKCLNANAPYVAVENPLPMSMANLPRTDCFIHPSWFGEKYTKKTLYWLKNLPPIMAEVIYPDARQFVRASRGKYRSRTFVGVARAIASQWSNYILQDMERK